MKQGFVTVATGKEEYYVLAHNLLLSYRYHAARPMPFALLCDRENEYTVDFDDVIVCPDARCDVWDKMLFVWHAPYDENIYIDADSLAYRDLNLLWKRFRRAPDFCVLGRVLPLDDPQGWFLPEYAGPYAKDLTCQIVCQGGIYFLRHGEAFPSFLATCRDVFQHFEDYHFNLYSDEALLSFACAVHRFYPEETWSGVFCYYPESEILSMDLSRGKLRFRWRYCPDNVWGMSQLLVHWGTRFTREDPYLGEAGKIARLYGEGKHAGRWTRVRSSLEVKAGRLRFRLKRAVPLFVKTAVYRLKH